jgi:hypothetical protein
VAAARTGFSSDGVRAPAFRVAVITWDAMGFRSRER